MCVRAVVSAAAPAAPMPLLGRGVSCTHGLVGVLVWLRNGCVVVGSVSDGSLNVVCGCEAVEELRGC